MPSNATGLYEKKWACWDVNHAVVAVPFLASELSFSCLGGPDTTSLMRLEAARMSRILALDRRPRLENTNWVKLVCRTSKRAWHRVRYSHHMRRKRGLLASAGSSESSRASQL